MNINFNLIIREAPKTLFLINEVGDSPLRCLH